MEAMEHHHDICFPPTKEQFPVTAHTDALHSVFKLQESVIQLFVDAYRVLLRTEYAVIN